MQLPRYDGRRDRKGSCHGWMEGWLKRKDEGVTKLLQLFADIAVRDA